MFYKAHVLTSRLHFEIRILCFSKVFILSVTLLILSITSYYDILFVLKPETQLLLCYNYPIYSVKRPFFGKITENHDFWHSIPRILHVKTT